MPLNARQSIFVDKMLEGHSGAESARLAGYSLKRAREAAYRLQQIPEVAQALADGRQASQKRTETTIDSMVKQFDEDRAFAIKTENASAAVRASEMKAKLVGLLQDKVNLSVTDERSDEELLDRIRFLSRELGIPVDSKLIEATTQDAGNA